MRERTKAGSYLRLVFRNPDDTRSARQVNEAEICGGRARGERFRSKEVPKAGLSD
jgi:hypothetical protein